MRAGLCENPDAGANSAADFFARRATSNKAPISTFGREAATLSPISSLMEGAGADA